MAANIGEIALLGVIGVSLQKYNTIGGITVDVTMEEVYEDTLEITEHPVEAGAQITDHSFKRPMVLMLSCGWSDSSSSGLSGLVALASPAVSSALSGISAASNLINPSAGNSGSFSGGAMVASDYVAGIYSQLLQLQESRQTLAVVASLRSYDDMLIQSLRVRRDRSEQYVLNVQATLRQVILVSTQVATLPPQSSQATPKLTADYTNAGTQAVQSASPSSGGAFSPFSVP